jgi:hypothetical protein
MYGRKAYKSLDEAPERKIPFGKCRRVWEDNI